MNAPDKTEGAPASAEPTKRKVFKMQPSFGGPWLLCLTSAEVAAMLDEADDDHEYIVKCAEMTDAEIESTGEFNGW